MAATDAVDAVAGLGQENLRPATRGPGRGRTSSQIGFYVVLVILSLVFILPLLWMLVTSFKTTSDATSTQSLGWIPNPFTSESYKPLASTTSQTPVVLWFLNSLAAAAINTVLIVVTASMAAYALARMDFPGKKLLFGLIVGTIFIPSFVLLIPNFLIVSDLGWLDSIWAIAIPSAGGAFGVFFLRQIFLALPREIEEAAWLDGANQFQIFLRIVLPLVRPGFATLAVLSFLTNWNELIWPVYVLFSPSKFTLPAGLPILQGAYNINYPIIMAGAVVASVPVIILFIFAQRHVIASVARSGLKG
jgi:multiple sugar transport system permease protein